MTKFQLFALLTAKNPSQPVKVKSSFNGLTVRGFLQGIDRALDNGSSFFVKLWVPNKTVPGGRTVTLYVTTVD